MSRGWERRNWGRPKRAGKFLYLAALQRPTHALPFMLLAKFLTISANAVVLGTIFISLAFLPRPSQPNTYRAQDLDLLEELEICLPRNGPRLERRGPVGALSLHLCHVASRQLHETMPELGCQR